MHVMSFQALVQAGGLAGLATESISCVRFLNKQHLLVMSAVGKCLDLDIAENGAALASWKVSV